MLKNNFLSKLERDKIVHAFQYHRKILAWRSKQFKIYFQTSLMNFETNQIQTLEIQETMDNLYLETILDMK